MEEFEKLEALIDHSAAYARNRIDEARLALTEKSSGIVAFIFVRATIILVFMISLLFASASAAIYLGDALGHREWLGFLIMAAIYFIFAWIVVAARDRLIRLPITNALIRQFFNPARDYEKN